MADPRCAATGGLGALCVVVELRRRVTDTYRLNACDPDLPLTVYIEHTNFVALYDYGGRRLAYLGRYFHSRPRRHRRRRHGEPALDRGAGRATPGFAAEDAVALHPSRIPYAAPLVGLGQLSRIPPVVSHIPGLYVCTTAQIYP